MDTSVSAIIAALGAGLPVLIGHILIVLVLLFIGMVLYLRLTPYDEIRLAVTGNIAGGLTFAGATIALAIPLATTLATSGTSIDILVWGAVAITLQLLAFACAARLIPSLSSHIISGNASVAAVLVGMQLAVALINAAAMAG